MKILITNDDGINAEILPRLAEWAASLGEVTVVAPKYEQSGKSHGISIDRPFEIRKMPFVSGITAYSADSTPADCVRFGIIGLKQQYDLVISGINKGYNMGRDILYSGTAAAAFEAACLGINAVALSTDPDSLDYAVRQLDDIREYFCRNQLFSKNIIYNVNIPSPSKGIRITRQGGIIYRGSFLLPEEGICQPVWKCVCTDTHNDELDTNTVIHGYTSVTPLTTDRTDSRVFHELASRNF